jgi:hypothetical protein
MAALPGLMANLAHLVRRVRANYRLFAHFEGPQIVAGQIPKPLDGGALQPKIAVKPRHSTNILLFF